MRGFFLLVALRECGAFLAGVFLPAPGARVVIVSDLAMAAVLSGVYTAVEIGLFYCSWPGAMCADFALVFCAPTMNADNRARNAKSTQKKNPF